MALGRVRLIWTTNFDKNVEDASAKVLGGTGRLTVATLDSAAIAEESIAEERWPVLAKLHGDFQSRRLKNTSDELITQNERLRTTLIDQSKRFGLVVAGYSGRDQSVMDALERGLDNDRPDPSNADNAKYAPLLSAVGSLKGVIPKIGISWREAIAIRLDLRRNRLWLLMEPTSWIDSLPGQRVPDEVKEFHRRKSAARYNKSWNALIEAWSSVLTGGKPSLLISAFGISDGVDATFEIGRITAFSRRIQGR